MLIQSATPLIGQRITLEPLNEAHRNELRVIANDPAIWTYMVTSAFSEGFDHWFDKAILQGQQDQIAYVVRDKVSQKLVGSSRLYFIELEHQRLHIGYTWFHPSVWGAKVNIETKYLMLTYAFETLGVNRVELMTDARNKRSQAAIKKIGGVEEGVLRKHMVLKDGHVRDSVVFSIIKPEWARVKAMLASKLNLEGQGVKG